MTFRCRDVKAARPNSRRWAHARWLWRRGRPRSRFVNFGVIDVAHAVAVDADDVDEFMTWPQVVCGEGVARSHDLRRGFVEAADADDEVHRACGQIARVEAVERAFGV